jgi:membrane protease YdiL (CAAX protease family)
MTTSPAIVLAHPLRSAGLLFGAMFVFIFAAGATAQALGFDSGGTAWLVELTLAVFTIVCLWRFHWWRAAGFATLAHRRHLPLLAVPFLLTLFSLTDGFKPVSAVSLAGFTVLVLLVGFAEEGFFRGVLLQALLPRGVLFAAMLSSVAFGLAHCLNALGTFPLDLVLLQMASGTGLGLAFAAVRLRNGSIWPIVLLHAFADWLAFWSMGGVHVSTEPTPLGLGVFAATGLLGAIYGVWVLYRRSAQGTLRWPDPANAALAEQHSAAVS